MTSDWLAVELADSTAASVLAGSGDRLTTLELKGQLMCPAMKGQLPPCEFGWALAH